MHDCIIPGNCVSKEIKDTELVIYNGANGEVFLSADYVNETVWATQAQIESLFAIDQSGVSRHVRNILKSGEVDGTSNMQKMHIANSDRPVTFYSLDIILAVGYRANSEQAISFRKWATSVLRQHILEGYTINEKRLEQTNKLLEIVSRSSDEIVSGVANVLQRYSIGLDLLDDYEHA